MSEAPPTAPALDRGSVPYGAFFCEENIWHLAQHEGLAGADRYVAFISNPDSSVALWGQQVAPPGEPVVWDYHVVLFARHHGRIDVYDLDSRLDFPTEMQDYLRETFPFSGRLPEVFRPLFRVVPAERFVAEFSSDRSHMNRPDTVVRPAPPWPPISNREGGPSNLMRFVAMDDGFLGEVLDLAGLHEWAEDDPR